MIKTESRELAWINARRKELRRADPGLIEKVICALTLLEQLVLADLDFVFKGGTAVLLSVTSQQSGPPKGVVIPT